MGAIAFSRNAQANRKLLLKINGAGLEKGLESYVKYGSQSDYTTKVQETIPPMKEYTGVVTTNTFKVTGVDLSTAVGKYLITWNPTDWATTVDKQKYALDIQKITLADFIVDTTLTVANNLPSNYTKGIILASPYLEVKGITDFGFNPSAADISANTNATGRAVVNDKGLYNFDITGINGLYGANIIPTQYQLRMGGIPSGAMQSLIVAMGTEVGELYFEGNYEVKTGTDGGAVGGDADQTIAFDLQYKSAGDYKKVKTAGSFTDGDIVEEI